MRLAPALRLLATAVLLFAGTAAIWWLVGYQIGKGVLSETGGLGPFRAAYGFEPRLLVELLGLALVAPLARVLWSGAGPLAGPVLDGWIGDRAPPWLAVAGLALGAGLLLGEKGGAALAVALFVFTAAAAAEAKGPARVGTVLAGAVLAGLAQGMALPVGFGERLLVVGLRAALFYGPLLAGPEVAERVLERA